MAEVTFVGKLIGESEQRDAIHIAVAPVKAAYDLRPGAPIDFEDRDKGTVRLVMVGEGIGIVDPFLPAMVKRGERFWMFLYPNTITSLRHNWTHPAFEVEVTRAYPASEAWIRDYSEGLGVGYGDMIDAAKNYIKSGQRFIRGGDFEGITTSPEFWTHFERVTGLVVPDQDRDSFFSCSC